MHSKFLIPLFSMSLTACATFGKPSPTVTSKSISSVPKITDDYRFVARESMLKDQKDKWLNEVNTFYPDGFSKISFASTENLENILIDGHYVSIGYGLKQCDLDYEEAIPIYGSEIFRLNAEVNDIAAPYYIFVPKNLETAVSGSVGAAWLIEKGELKVPQDLRDLCVFITAHKYWSHTLFLDLGSINEIMALSR